MIKIPPDGSSGDPFLGRRGVSRFCLNFLDKAQKDLWLPKLFEILYHNMKDIAPSGVSYEEEWEDWVSAVGPALDKAPRQIILIHAGDSLAGYFQYYVNGGVFMVEEIQIVPEYQGTTLFCALFRFLARVLPEGIETIAAYAHKSNLRSQKIMMKLGMEKAGESEGNFCCFKGDFRLVAARFQKR